MLVAFGYGLEGRGGTRRRELKEGEGGSGDLCAMGLIRMSEGESESKCERECGG